MGVTDRDTGWPPILVTPVRLSSFTCSGSHTDSHCESINDGSSSTTSSTSTRAAVLVVIVGLPVVPVLT